MIVVKRFFVGLLTRIQVHANPCIQNRQILFKWHLYFYELKLLG